MPVPTRRLALLAAIAAIPLLVFSSERWALFLGVNAVILGLWLLDGVLAPAPATIDVTRSHPDAMALGQWGTLDWSVRNTNRRAVSVALADDLAPSLHADARRFHARVAAGDVVRASVRIHPSRRGRFGLSELVVRVDGPLGLASRQRSRVLDTVLRVFPPFRSKDEAELRINRARILDVGLRSARGRGGGTEFEQLEEYNPDHEFRRIDWSATARTGKAVVRTYRAERNQHVLMLLDNGRVMAGRVDGVPRVEHAMDAVMMLTAVATRLGDRTGLVIFDRQVRAVVPPSAARHQFGRVVEAMYRLEPELAESDYRGAFAYALSRFTRRALVVVLTELAEAAVEETLIPALPVIARHHIVMVAGVLDPDVKRWATEPATDGEAAYRKAAAVAALARRRQTVARLRAAGATVIDAPPGRLAPELADAYLRVKATGRL